MRRVLIIGNAGSGKTTFANQLADRLSLPVHHLDKLYWQAGWVRCDEAVFAEKVTALAATDFWIMEGNYKECLSARLARADLVIFLDIGRYRCLWNVFLRTLASKGKVRAHMAAGCPEHFSLWFFRYIWDYPARFRPVLLEMLKGYEGEIVTLTEFPAYEAFLANIGGK